MIVHRIVSVLNASTNIRVSASPYRKTYWNFIDDKPSYIKNKMLCYAVLNVFAKAGNQKKKY